MIKRPFIDDYAFDLGYHHSYALSVFTLCLIFGAVVPVIGFFGFIFFLFKYYVDKYNLTFVYMREFDGGGVIKKKVIPFTLFAIYVFQILNIGYFGLKFNKTYLAAGLVYLLI